MLLFVFPDFFSSSLEKCFEFMNFRVQNNRFSPKLKISKYFSGQKTFLKLNLYSDLGSAKVRRKVYIYLGFKLCDLYIRCLCGVRIFDFPKHCFKPKWISTVNDKSLRMLISPIDTSGLGGYKLLNPIPNPIKETQHLQIGGVS